MHLGPRPLSVAALLVAAALLAGCDAGNAEPGSDNRWPGPELTIVAPGPGQVVDLKTWVDVSPDELPEEYQDDPDTPEQPQVARYRMPQAYFEVLRPAPPAEHVGDHLLWRLDGGRWQRLDVADWRKPLSLGERPMQAGSHVLQACVVNAEGVPYANRQAASTRLFHLHADDGGRDLYDGERDPPLIAFDERQPALLVVGPTGVVPAGEVALRYALSGATLGERTYRVAYRVDGGDWQHAYEAGSAPLGTLAAGTRTVDVRLEAFEAGKASADDETAKGMWSPLPRPRFARGMKQATPGELNRQRLSFIVK